MKVVAITRFKHGAIFGAITRLEWTQAELARRCNMHQTKIGMIINMKRRPTEEDANRIQVIFAKEGEFIDVLEEWPEAFKGFDKTPSVIQLVPIQLDRLLSDNSRPIYDKLYAHDMTDKVDEILSELSEREQRVIEMRFFDGLTLEESGEEFGLSKDGIRQIEAKALRRLRFPLRIRKVDGLLPEHASTTE